MSASALAIAAPAGAATYFFTAGTYAGPDPLLSPDILEIQGGSTKVFSSNFANQSGLVNWREGNLLIGGGANISNASEWMSYGNLSIGYTSGGGAFLNSGTFANAGLGNTTNFDVFLDNSGTIDAAAGTIRLGNGGIFRSGSQYLGTGAVIVASNISFIGNQDTQSLLFQNGAFSGTGAQLSGTADWTGGTFTGDWAIDAGATLTSRGGATRVFGGGTFALNGTLAWEEPSNALFGGGVVLTNNGLMDFNAGSRFGFTSGGGSLVNSAGGEIGAANGVVVNLDVPLINEGGLLTSAGIINYGNTGQQFLDGTRFAGTGANRVNTNAAFSGTINSENLELRGGQYQGAAAGLAGEADWFAGNFAGDWTLASGAGIDVLGPATRSLANGSFINNGILAWQESSTLLFAGNSVLTNNASLQFLADSSFGNSSGGGALVNAATGTIDVASGVTWSLAMSGFANNAGTINSDGLINFNVLGQTFNDGTQFTGSGASRINTNAVFNGGFNSANLELRNGNYSGGNAELSGIVDWYGGNIVDDWTVTAGAILVSREAATRSLFGGTLANNGTITWADSNTTLFGGEFVLTNNALMDVDANVSFGNNSGGGSFVNGPGGLVDVATGHSLTVSNSFFANNGGELRADGVINFNAGGQQFNGGSFTGIGENRVNTSAVFAGALSSQNLVFAGGLFGGNAAVLDGAAEWRGGDFTGGWRIGPDAEMIATGASTRTFAGGTFVNDGRLTMSSPATTLLGGGVLVTNNGLIDFQSDSSFGGFTTGAGSVVNNGLIEKTGGSGTTALLPSGNLTNNGTINVLSGTIAFNTNFANGSNGTLSGTGVFQHGGTLTNAGTIAPGDIGMTGMLQLNGNYLQTETGALASQLFSLGSYDRFNISGSATLDGTLALSCLAGCMLNVGDSFVLLDSVGALSGVFAGVTTSGFNDGFAYDLLYDYDNDLVKLTVTNVGVPGGGIVPEPSVWAMLIIGFGAVGGALRRSRRRFVRSIVA
ncbi:PEPxxWA-CTERM sorting domain-containing protein [Qipengyuania sp.]|uniref:PEPxxWA-CTERM sorting domain-containing protein n=1 Tax=Qipengyuania sp. TaxID=2004515 RepID=UPI0035C84133